MLANFANFELGPPHWRIVTTLPRAITVLITSSKSSPRFRCLDHSPALSSWPFAVATLISGSFLRYHPSPLSLPSTQSSPHCCCLKPLHCCCCHHCITLFSHIELCPLSAFVFTTSPSGYPHGIILHLSGILSIICHVSGI